MYNTKNTEVQSKTCNIHLIADGPVLRTIKEDGTVKRVRRCHECGELVKTIEFTEDRQVKEAKRMAEIMEGWHKQAQEAESIIDCVKMVFEAVERLQEQVRVAPGPEDWEADKRLDSGPGAWEDEG